VLAVVAVVRHPLLLAVGRIVGPVQVQQDAGGRTGPPALADVQVRQRLGQPLDGMAVDRVLQPGERRLARQVRLGSLAGSRPQASLNAGSVRRVSASSWSS
jgi:hypothetical protein